MRIVESERLRGFRKSMGCLEGVHKVRRAFGIRNCFLRKKEVLFSVSLDGTGDAAAETPWAWFSSRIQDLFCCDRARVSLRFKVWRLNFLAQFVPSWENVVHVCERDFLSSS